MTNEPHTGPYDGTAENRLTEQTGDSVEPIIDLTAGELSTKTPDSNAVDEIFESTATANADTQSEVLLRLTAVTTAINAERRKQRLDVVGDVIEGVLHLKGPMTVEEIVNQANQMWATDSMTPTLIERSLKRATEARLLVEEKGLDDVTRIRLTEDTKKQLDTDTAWAERVLDYFSEEFEQRLAAACDSKIKAKRVPTLRTQLLAALVEGTSGKDSAVFDVDPGRVSARFNLRSIDRYIRKNVQPKQVAEAMARVAMQAADGHDDFGNEVIHLLMTGALLRTALTNSDIDTAIQLKGVRLALDTSTLMYAINQDPQTRALFERFIAQSIEAGVQINVAEHTIAEWDRVWESAAGEVAGKRKRRDREWAARNPDLVTNPVARAYLYAFDKDSKLTWRRYELEHRKIGSKLEQLGINLRPAGNHQAQDIQLAQQIEQQLVEWADEKKTRFDRTATGAQDDAASCAMVARWRRNKPGDPATAWFVGTDTYTGRAYKRACPDDQYNLHVTPQAWMLYLATLRQDAGSTSVADLSQIAKVLTREAVMTLASTYPVTEAAAISRILGEDNGHIPPEDLREITQLEFARLAQDANDSRNREDVLKDTAEILRKREIRRTQSVERATEMAVRREQEAAQAQDDALKMQAESLTKAMDAQERMAQAEAKAEAKDAELRSITERNRLRVRRNKYVGVVILIWLLYALARLQNDDSSALLWVVGALLLAAFCVHMYSWVKNEPSIGDLLRRAAMGSLVTVALVLFEEFRTGGSDLP